MSKVSEHIFRFEAKVSIIEECARKFERILLGKKIKSYAGPYLYRDIIDNTLISSWEKPIKHSNYLYTGGDIGYNTDALVYYKNT